ncbi:MAG: M56 family metallopeptidase, partial [Candidatus Krumholzibacteria bacterium]|nr:M56 family metallopeptidase [Candidatus Krumholzibacteria bacterium]
AVDGLVRPRIVVPEDLIRELPEEQLCAILLHEDAHRRRRDPLRTAAGRLGLAIFFFYPLIYPVLHRLKSTAEYACDESVVHSGVTAGDYSRALARTLELGLAMPAFAAAAAAGGSLLRRRLRRLPTLNSRRYAMRLKYQLLLVAAALIVAAATFYPVPMRAGSAQGADSSAAVQRSDAAGIINAFDEAPVLVKKAAPVYPEEAKKLGVQAMVRLSLVIDENGRVTDATIVPADAEGTAGAAPETELEGEALSKLDKPQLEELRASFEKSAREAAMKWEFKPASLKGKAVKTRVAVPVRFRLN